MGKTAFNSACRIGNLTIKGKTNNIAFPANITLQDDTIKISSTFDINRQDWGISFKGKPDHLIRDEVVLKLDLIATK